MQNLGIAIGLFGILLAGLLLVRGIGNKCLRQFPLFYSYIVYVFCGSILMYGVYWLKPAAYPSIYWLFFLISILVEFSVVAEISDHIFKNLPALRYLGRAITLIISASLALVYILPVIIRSPDSPAAFLGFALRASVTKVFILAVLFLVAQHYRLDPGRSVVGLMFGFSIYLGVNVANFAASVAYGIALYSKMLWIMSPIAFTLCLLVWTYALWEFSPQPNRGIVSLVPTRDSEAMTLKLTRFNDELSKLTEK